MLSDAGSTPAASTITARDIGFPAETAHLRLVTQNYYTNWTPKMSKKRPYSKSPSYLILSKFGYCFRLSVPQDLRAIVGATEFRYSLRTCSIAEAKYKARRMAGLLQAILREIRSGRAMRDLSKEDIKRLVQDVLRKDVAFLTEEAVNRTEPLTIGQHAQELRMSRDAIDMYRQLLGRSDYGYVASFAEILLQMNDLKASPDSPLFKRLCHELLKAGVEVNEIGEKCLSGDYSFEEKVEKIPTPAKDQRDEPDELLWTVVEKYVQEQERGGNWKPRTKDEFRACLNLLKEVIGNVPVKSIGYDTMRAYKEILMRLPANREKKSEYKGKSPQELLEMGVTAPMSITSANKYLNRASSLFNYAVKNGYTDKNPASGMQIKQTKRDDEYRDPFSDQDLYNLFHSAEYREDSHKASYCFWVPLIGLFTGCRLEEICQLHLDDIQQQDGVWGIDINNIGEKTVKTRAALRFVPLHPFLEDKLKLVQYAEALRSQGEKRLFPELRHRRDGYGQTVSRWFARYRKRCGVVGDDKRKDFHSFRHTVTNALKQAQVDGIMISELEGHEVESITMSRYGKRFKAGILLEHAVKKLTYNIDLSHLESSKFAGREGP
jgi:integrase